MKLEKKSSEREGKYRGHPPYLDVFVLFLDFYLTVLSNLPPPFLPSICSYTLFFLFLLGLDFILYLSGGGKREDLCNGGILLSLVLALLRLRPEEGWHERKPWSVMSIFSLFLSFFLPLFEKCWFIFPSVLLELASCCCCCCCCYRYPVEGKLPPKWQRLIRGTTWSNSIPVDV